MAIESFREEGRYGIPAADQIIFNRNYVIGYSYYFRQARWALEKIDSDKPLVERINDFRADFRIPTQFRADLADYKGSGYDRGHLIASGDQGNTLLQNSETFLLSNMSPQAPRFNEGIWKYLEEAIRILDSDKDVFETYVICGPLFYFDKKIDLIGKDYQDEVAIPIPHAYFKSVLTESNKGKLKTWSFIIPNEGSDQKLDEFLVSIEDIEKLTGLRIWSQLTGKEIEKEKEKVKKSMWKY